MIPKKLILENIGPISSFEHDFEAMGSGVFAIAGDNGTGKTHVINSLFPTPLFRKWPDDIKSIKSKSGAVFIDHCTGKKSKLDYSFSFNNKEYRILLIGEKKYRKQEAYIWEDGVNLNTSGKLPEFDKVIASRFPPEQVVLAVPFAMQGGEHSFFRIDEKQRKALVSKLLGIEHFEIEVEKANNQLRDLSSDLENQSADLAKLQAEIDRDDELLKKAEDFSLNIQKNDLLLSDLNIKRNVLAVNLEEARVQHQSFLSAQAEIQAIDKRLSELEEFSSLKNKREIYEQVLTHFPEPGTGSSLHVPIANCYSFLHKLQEIEIQDRQLNKKLTYADKDVEAVERELGKVLESLGCLDDVDLDHPMCRVCPLTESLFYSSFESKILEDKVKIKKDITRRKWSILEETTDLPTVIAVVKYTIDRYAAAAGQEGRIKDDTKWTRERLLSYIEKIQEKISDSEISELRERRARLTEVPLVNTSRLEAELGEVDKRIAEVKAEISLFEKNQREILNARIRESDRWDKEEIIEGLLVECKKIKDEIQDLTDLSEYLTTLRTLTIDEACPDIEDIANSLLTEYQGGRFRVRLDTQTKRAGVGNKGFKEDFALTVIDTETGREGTHASGGETVILDEAIRLAFSIFNKKRNNYTFKTLFRDETTSFLSENKASAYMQMLRRALEVGGFHQIIFISHFQHIWQQADSVIFLGNENN